jgi:hypothetical protein
VTTDTRPYPVALRGDLTIPPSRWLWLIKWLLLVPHFIIVYFLGIAAFVLMVIAFFAILFSRKYPRGMFDFVVGVMRWGWRVNFYGGLLATDKYPPFSLDPDPNYPADLSIEYPEKLNNGLVLVKFWLLAIPHYIIVWLLFYVFELLVLVVAIVLLFTGKYLPELFKINMGINRWMYRVYAYIEMTDMYPTFKFWDDLGIGLAK